jgi:hypothetical protein
MQTITITLPTYEGMPAPGNPEDGRAERICRLCDKPIQCDLYIQPVMPDRVALTVVYGTVHAACYAERIEHLDAAEAWLVVAQDIARRPSRFTATEIRAAFLALFRIARARDEAPARAGRAPSALPPHDQSPYRVWVCPYCLDHQPTGGVGAVSEATSNDPPVLRCGICERRWDLDGTPLPAGEVV